MTRAAILVIDDEPKLREGLAELLRKERYDVHVAPDGETGLQMLRREHIQVVLTDLLMPGLDGLAVLRHIKEGGLDVEVILLTGHGSIPTAVDAMKQGAYDYLTKPPDTDHLLRVVRRAADHHALVHRTRALEAAQANAVQRPLIAQSPAMTRVLTLVQQVAASDATVLIQGESGTGKELIARAIHTQSARRTHPLIAVNCAAIPENLLESELFGHEKGAFTGALQRKLGKFELAHGGTLFLDEIAELALPVQAKLLRVLQEREVERVGGVRPIPIDVRIVAATNQQLHALVDERRFRADLYFRLKVVTVTIPPLRDRPEDLLPLAEHFLGLHARRLGKAISGFDADAMTAMRGYGWPGNVRELEHTVQRAAILAVGASVSSGDLGLTADDPASVLPPTGGTLEAMERHWILTTLKRHGGSRRAAAKALGIDRSTMHRKLGEYGQ